MPWTDEEIESILTPYRSEAQALGAYTPQLETAARNYITSGQYDIDVAKDREAYGLMEQLSAMSGGGDNDNGYAPAFKTTVNPYKSMGGYYGLDNQPDLQVVWRDNTMTHTGYTGGSTPGGFLGDIIPMATQGVMSWINPVAGGAMAALTSMTKDENIGNALLKGVATYGAGQLASSLGSLMSGATDVAVNTTGDALGAGMGGAGEAYSGLYAGMGGAGEAGVYGADLASAGGLPFSGSDADPLGMGMGGAGEYTSGLSAGMGGPGEAGAFAGNISTDSGMPFEATPEVDPDYMAQPTTEKSWMDGIKWEKWLKEAKKIADMFSGEETGPTTYGTVRETLPGRSPDMTNLIELMSNGGSTKPSKITSGEVPLSNFYDTQVPRNEIKNYNEQQLYYA